MASWDAAVPGAVKLHDLLIALLRDTGAGLSTSLYEEAITHLFGGPQQVQADVAVAIDGHVVGQQRMRLIAPGVAFKMSHLRNTRGGCWLMSISGPSRG